MPAHCCVPQCKQRGFRDEDGSKVSFFSFPKDADWKKRWIIAIKRDEGPFFTVTKFTKVCSRHFTEDNYLPNVAGNRRFLKQDAVPSIFAFSAPRPPPRKKPRNREPRNLVTATAPSEDERSTTADVSDVDICSPSTSVTNSIGDVVCGCACSFKISDLTEQLDVVTARVRALESEVKKKTEEVELFKSSFYKAERALEIAAQERSQLEKRLSRKFSVQCFRDSPDDTNFYTGLPDYKAFMELFELLDPGENCENIKAWSRNYADCHTNAGRPHLLPAREQLFLVLVRLRLGLFEKDLAYRFQISLPTVSRLCTTWISFMYLQIGQLNLWWTRDEVNEAMPPAFIAQGYSSTRAIIDATEIRCEVPSSLVLQSQTYSNYKSANTLKSLIVISPDGTITFLSKLFAGSLSDKELVEKSGFFEARV
ncbi:hypothetical protein MTO96_030589 [Rhipicephalus appendiculatus]